MTDDKTKKSSAQPQGMTAPVAASSILISSQQAGPVLVRMGSQQQVIASQQLSGHSSTNIQQQQQQQPMRTTTTASSNVPPMSTQRFDGMNSSYSQSLSDNRQPMQEGYSRQHAVSSQYYPRVLPPGSQMTTVPPIHPPGSNINIPFAYNPVYTGTQQQQQNIVSSSYLPQVYTQSNQQSIYPRTLPNTSQIPWVDSQSMHPAGHLIPQPESSPTTSHTASRSQQFRRSTQQHPLLASTIAYPSIVLPISNRPRSDRPVEKLSLALIETYKKINEVYFEEREFRRKQDPTAMGTSNTVHPNSTSTNYGIAQSTLNHKRPANKHPTTISQTAAQTRGTGVNNNGWDDENFDYVIMDGELIYDRYSIQERIGKGSFGQVVRAYDTHANIEVAIKIIKSKKPFLIQARTEIELLSLMNEKDPEGQQNIVRLLTHFIYRNHQCLVFEMLSLNLYDLLKNTQFAGVSLNLLRKFGRQILKALHFLGRSDVDIIHCDLKPENILLKHPKRSNVKVIDFGSSCKSNKRMYTYIQSRFYRSPEVILGLPYTMAIDMWSLGCILVEMYTGEPLFSGTDQFDQMHKIVKILGMIPDDLLNQCPGEQKFQFFERVVRADGIETWILKQREDREHVIPSSTPLQSLSDSIGPEAAKKKKESSYPTGNTPENYQLFIDLIFKMLALRPDKRIKPQEALRHPFIADSSMPSSGPDVSVSSSTEEVKKSC